MSGAAATRVRAAIEPVLAGAGFHVEDVAVRAAGKRQLVQVVVDRDGGLTLDDVADASHVVSAALDEAEPLSGAYVLEVTSPGVDRPLTQPRHWRRNLGRLVDVSVVELGRIPGPSRIVAVDDEGADLQGPDGQARRVWFHEVTKATIVLEFSRTEEDDA